jgi:hypothetical protein
MVTLGLVVGGSLPCTSETVPRQSLLMHFGGGRSKSDGLRVDRTHLGDEAQAKGEPRCQWSRMAEDSHGACMQGTGPSQGVDETMINLQRRL